MRKDVLRNDKINPYIFVSAIRSTIKSGHEKGNKCMIIGSGDCAKTFLLLPITVVFHAFSNPAWVGVENKEVIFLNDICWSETTIEWGMFLNLLDGNQVRFPQPKNLHDSDIITQRENKVPVFATSIDKIKFNWEKAK